MIRALLARLLLGLAGRLGQALDIDDGDPDRTTAGRLGQALDIDDGDPDRTTDLTGEPT